MRHAVRKDKQLRHSWRWLPAFYLVRSNNFLRYRFRSVPVPFSSYSLTRVHNFCGVTGRSRAIFSNFGVSRHILKRLVSLRKLFGIQKSSW